MLSLCAKTKHYLTETNHPLVQLFYILIGPISYLFYFKLIYIDKYPLVGLFPFLIGNAAAALGFYNYFMACKVDPGLITDKNNAALVESNRIYSDGRTFSENIECKTCKLVKSAQKARAFEALQDL